MNKTWLISGVSISLGSLLFATIVPIQPAKAQISGSVGAAMIEAGRSKRATELLQRGGSPEDAAAILRGENPGSQKVTPNSTATKKAAPKARFTQKKRK